MLASILASGLAVGAIYALIGIAYNTMFSTSRVMSFTAGQLGMLGGVLRRAVHPAHGLFRRSSDSLAMIAWPVAP